MDVNVGPNPDHLATVEFRRLTCRFCCLAWFWGGRVDAAEASLFEPVAVFCEGDDVGVVDEAVDHRRRRCPRKPQNPSSRLRATSITSSWGYDAVIRNIGVFMSDARAGSWDVARPRSDTAEAIAAPEGYVGSTLLVVISYESQVEFLGPAVGTRQFGNSVGRRIGPLESFQPFLV